MLCRGTLAVTTPSVKSPPSETPPAGESDPAGEHARGPRPAEGIELIGEYEGSGFIEAQPAICV